MKRMTSHYRSTGTWISARAILVAAIVVVAGQAPALAAGFAHSGSFDQVATISTPRYNSKQTDHVSFQGARYRLDGTDPDTFMMYSEINDGQSDYYYVPSRSGALRVSGKNRLPALTQQLQEQTTQQLQGALKTGETSVNNFDCDVYTHTLPDGSKVTLYQSKDPRFPFIIKTQLVVAGESVTRSSSIENIKLDVSVDDVQYTLPQGTKITDAPPPGATTAPTTPPQTAPVK